MAATDPRPLAALTRSPGYAHAIVQTATEIATATETSTVLALLIRATAQLGADASFYSSFFGEDTTRKSYRGLMACGPLWEMQYAQNHWYMDDPWLQHASRHTEPARTEELPPLTDRQRWVVDAAAHFGFVSSMVVPVPSPAVRARTGALCLGSSRPRFFHDSGYPAFRVLARIVAMELGDWQFRQIRHQLIRSARINENDLVLLRHEQLGHSSKVIAAALHTEPNTIDTRFHRLRLRLCAPNRRAALRIAEIHGLV